MPEQQCRQRKERMAEHGGHLQSHHFVGLWIVGNALPIIILLERGARHNHAEPGCYEDKDSQKPGGGGGHDFCPSTEDSTGGTTAEGGFLDVDWRMDSTSAEILKTRYAAVEDCECFVMEKQGWRGRRRG